MNGAFGWASGGWLISVSYVGIWAIARGKIPRNRYVGVRTRPFTDSDENWREGHRLLLPYVVAGVAGCLLATYAEIRFQNVAPTWAGTFDLAAFVSPIAGLLLGIAVVRRQLERRRPRD